TLIGVSVQIIDLHPHAVAVGAVGNVERFAVLVDDQGIAVFAPIDPPLLAGRAIVGNSPDWRAVGVRGSIHGIAVHSVADVVISRACLGDYPGLVIGAPRRELDHGALIISVEV